MDKIKRNYIETIEEVIAKDAKVKRNHRYRHIVTIIMIVIVIASSNLIARVKGDPSAGAPIFTAGSFVVVVYIILCDIVKIISDEEVLRLKYALKLLNEGETTVEASGGKNDFTLKLVALRKDTVLECDENDWVDDQEMYLKYKGSGGTVMRFPVENTKELESMQSTPVTFNEAMLIGVRDGDLSFVTLRQHYPRSL